MYSTVQKMASCQPSALVHMDGDTMRFGISMGGGNLCLLIKVSVPSLVVGYAALAAGAGAYCAFRTLGDRGSFSKVLS